MNRFLPRFLSFDSDVFSPEAAAKMISEAKESIKIIMPDAAVDFSKNELIISAIKRAIEKGVSVKVVYHPSSETEKRGILCVPGVEAFEITEPRKRLVLIIDRKSALVLHTPIDIGRDMGIIIHNAGKLSHEFDSQFNQLAGI